MWRWLLLLCGGVAIAGCGESLHRPVSAESEEVALTLERGLAYLQQRQLQRAQQQLQQLLRHSGANPQQRRQAHYSLALVAMEQKEEDAAEHHFQTALQLLEHEPYPDADNGYAVLLCRQGRRVEADDHFRRALQHAPPGVVAMVMKNRRMCGEGTE